MNLYGLIGNPLSQSFSKKYFSEKFEKEEIPNTLYELFPLENINLLKDLLVTKPNLKGLNVTIPYKEQVLPFLHTLNPEAEQIAAVNCIKIEDGKLTGYNTDAPAFKQSLLSLLEPHHSKALVLGTGGAAKAVLFVLKQLNIFYSVVSRNAGAHFTYSQINKEIIEEYPLIINCTPLGSYPKVNTAPDIPYQYLSPKDYLYDLVYNPAKTSFLQKGEKRGAVIKNGYDMLVGQAELSWKIWNS